ncbi:MAG: ADP-forming succinate--CoA ligase subunit beta [Candidatus Dadabacteria bacterium]|nr:MAG: ADP-forming succinate--CoA ligase subunit beta [Candidatus Dadabacteria bacterium]
MNLHEYQSKQLMSAYGLPILDGVLCYTPGEVEAAVDNLGGDLWVIKAQVHAGGRGKAGGVKLARSAEEARKLAESIIGMRLVTPQTGKAGKLVRKVYVEKGCNISKEFYLSMLVDRAAGNISIVASSEGGMDIEEVAEKSPDKIIRVGVNYGVGLLPFQCVQLGLRLGLNASQARKLSELLYPLYDMFLENDLSLLEINPLVLTAEDQFIVLDAKCSIDNNSLFRHPDLKELKDYDEIDPKDLQAGKHGLSYVALDGTIGCMVNGAGLAMATMDIIKHYGGSPANFLDVGGGASKETVTEAFKILLSDKNVRAILINIFGGIMKCDVIANGVVEAAKELGVNVPLVVRLQGTNVDLGRKILADSGLKITPAETMAEAAQAAVNAAK